MTANPTPPTEDEADIINADQVRAFLKANPDFLSNNQDIFSELTSPEQDLGNGIIDFQHYMVKNLQEDSKDLKSRYELLVDFCRDNMSVQSQVHQAILRLIRANNLEQLLEIIAIDLVGLFDVDVVRLAMESDTILDTSFGEAHYSGFVFTPAGTINAVLGQNKNILLIEDCELNTPAGFEHIFADCENLIQSCALLRLEMETIDYNIMLAFGVRHKKRFHTGQGIELLQFLSQIIAYQLDRYLDDIMI